MEVAGVIAFSPIEEGVLAAVGAEWSTVEELQKRFYPGSSPEVVRRAVEYLKRKELVASIERQHGQPILEQTPVGFHALCACRRARAAVTT